MMFNIILFTIFSITGILASILILTSLNPINRLAYLIVIYIKSGFIYLLLDFTFLGITYIIVYVGAIAILFIFVIMMAETLLTPKRIGNKVFKPINQKILNINSKDKMNTSNINLGKYELSIFLFLFVIFFFDSPSIFFDLTSNLSFDIYSYFFMDYSTEFYNFTDIHLFGYFLYLVHPFNTLLLSIILWCILLGVLRISTN